MLSPQCSVLSPREWRAERAVEIQNPKSEIRISSACGELNHEPVEWLPNRHRSSVYGELSRTVVGHRPAVSAVEPSSVLSPQSSARGLLATVALVLLFLSAPNLYAADYVIGSADVLFISVLGNTELDTVARVTPTGTISVPLVGDVQAAGLTAQELAGRLTRALAKKIRNPVVSVSLREINSYRVYILGSVAKPGVVSSKSEITWPSVEARSPEQT